MLEDRPVPRPPVAGEPDLDQILVVEEPRALLAGRAVDEHRGVGVAGRHREAHGLLVALASGLVFGLGLSLSGMLDPVQVRRIADRRFDAENPRTRSRELVTGEVSPAAAWAPPRR